MKNAMWLADFDFQTSGWIFSVSLYPNESTESVTSRFPPKMGNSSTPNYRLKLTKIGQNRGFEAQVAKNFQFEARQLLTKLL